jgi:hypothetical protein
MGRSRSATEFPARAETLREAHPPAWEGLLGRVSKAALVLSTLWLAASTLLIQVVHVGDRYAVGYVQGTRMALAAYLNEGTLYPPLFDGSRYGGTRFMPIPTALHAALARWTDEYLVSGKVVGYVSAALLVGLVYVVLRRIGLDRLASAAISSSILATVPGFFVARSIQGDALPVVFQLAAVLTVTGVTPSTSRRPVVIAAVLCTLGVLSKLTAVWAPLAIAVWLLVRARRHLVWFAGAFLLLLGGSVGVLQLLTHGEFMTNMVEVSLAGVGSGTLLGAPARAVDMIERAGPVAVALVFLALARVGLGVARRAWSPYAIAFLFGLVVLMIQATDLGVSNNHVIDVVTLAAVCVGELVWILAERGQPVWGRAAVALVLAGCVGLFAGLETGPAVAQSIEQVREGTVPEPANPLARQIRPGDSVLSEDPAVPVLLDRLPVVLDAWVLLRLEDRHLGWIAALADRIDRREFDAIVLVQPIDSRQWYDRLHFGPTIASAIRRSYCLVSRPDRYYLYRPGDLAGGCPRPVDSPSG